MTLDEAITRLLRVMIQYIPGRMETPPMKPPAREPLSRARRTAIHLEVRDQYASTDPDFLERRKGRRTFTPDHRTAWWEGRHDAVRAAVSRGVSVRRARVVSEPLTEYVRWEHDYAVTNVVAGEDVRRLPRRRAKDLAVPAVDFRVFDGELVPFPHVSGDGVLMEREYVNDATLAAWCTDAFNAVRERATPHEEYKPESLGSSSSRIGQGCRAGRQGSRSPVRPAPFKCFSDLDSEDTTE